MRVFRNLLASAEDGFMLVTGLMIVPVMFCLFLLVIDIGRVNNAHADLQTVADAAALAGARELDNSPAAIANARLAMAEVTNTVAMLAKGGPGTIQSLTFANTSGNAITAVFLDEIPAEDDTPIDAAWISAHNVEADPNLGPEDAEYVLVQVQATNFDPFFFLMNSLTDMNDAPEIPVGARAVAKSVSAACNVTPLYICNPFEFDSAGNYQGGGLQEAFREGELHSRLIKLHPRGNDTASPGNFGFLQVLNDNGSLSSSADAVRDIFAGDRNPTCYDSEEVTTKPGAATSIRQGINVRFDIYEGVFANPANPSNPNYFPVPPAQNVRKGYKQAPTGPNNACNTTLADDHFGNPDGVIDGMWGFPDDNIMSPPNQGIAGAFFGNGEWDIDGYLAANYGAAHVSTIKSLITSSFPLRNPSRYDVYLAEQTIDHPAAPGTKLFEYVNTSDPTFGNESGEALCAASKNPSILPSTSSDRRLTFAAIIDCRTNSDEGGGINDYPVNSYVSLFLTRPMEQNGSLDSTIDVEIVDITGSGSGGSLEDFVRDEAVLVR